VAVLSLPHRETDSVPSIAITGCNRGTGEGIARVLHQAGFRVIGLNRSPPAEPVTPFLHVSCDIRNPDDVARAAQQLPDDLTAVVANAGIRRFAEVESLSLQDWKDSVDTNLNGVFYLARATVPLLKKTRGYFVVVGSHAEKYPFERGSAYCSTKLALRGLVDCLIEETRHHGVRATYLSLGSIRNREHGGDESWKLTPENVGQVVLSLLRLPDNILIPYLDARPLQPLRSGKAGIDRLQDV
jgi:NAD(P)-dependent dehydrogenase (short-subunit alcohol dehydrogenase family)